MGLIVIFISELRVPPLFLRVSSLWPACWGAWGPATIFLVAGPGVVASSWAAPGYITPAVLGRRKMRRLRLVSTAMAVLGALLLASDEGGPGADSLAFGVVLAMRVIE